VIKLERIRDWILPELIHLDPMVATAFYRAVAEDEATRATAAISSSGATLLSPSVVAKRGSPVDGRAICTPFGSFR
jgi:hypothetical protein